MIERQWLNGRIVIYNGDCFDVMRDLDCKIDCIITDPPYNLLNHKIETNIDIQEFLNLSKKILNNNSFIAYFGQQPMITDWNVLANKLFNYKNEVIWYKKKHSSPYAEMKRVFENIMIYQKGNKKYNQINIPYIDDIENMGEFISIKQFKKHLNAIQQFAKEKRLRQLITYLRKKDDYSYKSTRNITESFLSGINNNVDPSLGALKTMLNGYSPRNLLSFARNNAKDKINHPTIKPLDLIIYLIELCSSKDDLIFDGFLGSGTTAISCIKTNRRFIGCELDKNYFNTICNRIDDETKQMTLF